MEHLPKKICQNGISYTLVGDYYIPDLQLPEESRPIGLWGRMHKAYLELCHPAQYNDLVLSGNLWTYLADLNEQAKNRLDCIIAQMKSAEGIIEELKSQDQMAWVGAMNSIRNRAEEIVRHELISDAKTCCEMVLDDLWICGTERGRMPPVGASEGVDRLKTAVCCRDGCQLVAGFVAGDFPVWIREKPVNKGYFNIYPYLRQRKQRDFSKKFTK